ncbi:hypothetical protein [uncultured Methanobrevibacter sp.]|uniref:hypothetical protein n=1 Tax=uncultured Methanobrevibacter sp. TaxID=253161 RepID=UPI00262ED7CE|nr:hypothetical protein [uncultured Methanobrevibacter sp.]
MLTDRDNIFNPNIPFDDEDLKKYETFLIHLSKKYGLGEVSFKPKNKRDWDSMATFNIATPNDWSFKQVRRISHMIVDDSLEFSRNEGLMYIFNNSATVLTQER